MNRVEGLGEENAGRQSNSPETKYMGICRSREALSEQISRLLMRISLQAQTHGGEKQYM